MVIDVNLPPDDPAANFEDFFRNFEDEPNHFKYREAIQEAANRKDPVIYVLFEDILLYDPPLADLIRDEPDVALQYAIESFKDILRFYSGGNIDEHLDYFVRITTKNKSNEVHLRGLRAIHIDKLIFIHGILIRASQIVPQITVATFQCPVCQTQMEIDQIDGNNLLPPKVCPNPACKNKGGFIVISKDSQFIDWQSILIQELPEELSPGRVPHSARAILTHDLVDSVRPGDRVKIMGVYKSYPKENSRGKASTIFAPFVKVLSIEGPSIDDNKLDITEEEEREIIKWSKKPDIQKIISESIAPGILGMGHLKMAAALALFSGVRKKMRDGSVRRGDIHVLFVGDPGTGKSQILKQCALVAPQPIFTSGKGASAAGLTAAVVRDPDHGGLSLEAGALVLADGGNAMIDEFDKMDKKDRSAIHEAMEQQSYHYNTEILSTKGNRFLIGEKVDQLFEENKEDIIKGIDCEILPFTDLELYSTDFTDIVKTKINRISRHEAPDRFFKFKFTNGREVIVTPEHPMYIYRDGNLQTIRADQCIDNDFIPSPSILPNSSKPIELSMNFEVPDIKSKKIIFPEFTSENLSKIIGYLITEGHSYKGSTAEIGFSNKDSYLLDEFEGLMFDVFGILPSYNNREDGLVTQRYLSVELFKWFEINFPSIMCKAREKRIPDQFMGGSSHFAQNLLRTAFKGDGSVESTSMCYRTASKGLAYDYQDLLLKLSIETRIVEDRSNSSYKVYIKGESFSDFYEKIVDPLERRYDKINNLVSKSNLKNRQHDIYPASVAHKIIDLKSKLSIPYNGYYHRHLKENHGITYNTLIEEIQLLGEKLVKIQDYLDINQEIKIQQFYESFGYSQSKIASLCKISRTKLNYYVNGGYDSKTRNEIELEFNSKIRLVVLEIKNDLEEIIKLTKSKIKWNRISDIQIIENKGKNYQKWVYDLTVEPNHTFISQGVVLHNTVSITKAGIIATLLARTSIIAAANPKFGRYTEHKNPTENINLSPPLLSRFDLIFVVKDLPNEDHDKDIADFILSMHSDETVESKKREDNSNLIPIDLLKKYIKYARNRIEPRLTPEAAAVIKQFYIELRTQNQDDENSAIAVVARNLEGYIRLAEAYAKMALKTYVSKEDTESALKLARRSLEDTSMDPVTGKLDADIILTGVSSAKKKVNILLDELKKKIEQNNNMPIDEEDFMIDIELMMDLDRDKVEEMLTRLKKEGILYSPPGGKLQMAKKPR